MAIEGFFPETEMPDARWWQVLWPGPAATLGILDVTPGLAVVDLCCGDGIFTAALAHLTGSAVHAIDIDPACLDRARAATQGDPGGDCRFVLGDAMAVDRLLAGPVDYVLLANALHGVPDQPRLARALAAVLRPGGRLAVINWHARPREQTTVLGEPHGPATVTRMTPESVVALLVLAGFRLERIVELPPYHYAAVFTLECG